MRMNPLQEAQKHIDALLKLHEERKLTWTQVEPPKPGALAYDGKAPGYSVLVVQADTVEYGRVYEGMMIVHQGNVSIIHLPPPVSKKLLESVTGGKQ